MHDTRTENTIAGFEPYRMAMEHFIEVYTMPTPDGLERRNPAAYAALDAAGDAAFDAVTAASNAFTALAVAQSQGQLWNSAWDTNTPAEVTPAEVTPAAPGVPAEVTPDANVVTVTLHRVHSYALYCDALGELLEAVLARVGVDEHAEPELYKAREAAQTAGWNALAAVVDAFCAVQVGAAFAQTNQKETER